MDESGDSASLHGDGTNDDEMSVDSSKNQVKFKAVRKFPSHPSVENDDDGDGDSNSEGFEGENAGDDNGSSVDDDDDEGEDDNDDDSSSNELDEVPAKKLKQDEDEKMLRKIVVTEDFVNFLCYRNYKEPPDIDEHRKVVTEYFKSDHTDLTGESSRAGVEPNKQIRSSSIESRASSKGGDERLTSCGNANIGKSGKIDTCEATRSEEKNKSGDVGRESRRKMLTKSASKSSRSSSLSPYKRPIKSPKDDRMSPTSRSQSLKNRLRPSTKALTAATNKEQLLNLKRKLSQEFLSCEVSESSCKKASKSSDSSPDTSRNIMVDQSDSRENYPDKLNTCIKFKDTFPINSTLRDFSDIHTFIAHLISSQNQPAFLIQPPSGFKIECNIPQEVRFSTHNQYVHRFHNRWGRNSIQLACITCHLDAQGTSFASHPLAGGVEMDLAGLSDAVCKHGGLQKVIDDVLWCDVIKSMKVPKMARDKISRFYEVYCRYLLSYDTLSPKDKSKLERKVLNDRDAENCDDLCVSKGRCRTLSELYDVARNLTSMFDLEDANTQQVLSTYWKILNDGNMHITVHTGFVKPSDISTSRRRSSLRNKLNLVSYMRCCDGSSCPVFADEDVLDSRLEVEMMFSTRCWMMDRHSRGTVSYNHTGADIVWYFVKGCDEMKLKKVLKALAPDLIDTCLSYWLPPNTIMLPPEKLMEWGIQVSRCTQEAGQFIIIPPNTFYSSVCCGYNISEHIHFLPHEWLPMASKSSINLHRSCYGPMFSLEKLVMMMLASEHFYHQHLQSKQHLSLKQMGHALNLYEQAMSRELKLRKALIDLGLKKRMEKLMDGEEGGSDGWFQKINNHKMRACHITKNFCFFSVVRDTQSDDVYCLECATKRLLKRKALNNFELIIFFNQSELIDMVSRSKKLLNTWK